MPSAPRNAALGFLSILEHEQHGLFGGYLLLNLAGRPLEFHCTAPIKPNRAQQILYGPTLEAFLYGEQIGRTLVGSAKTEPLLICTDREPAMALRELVEMPIALILDSPLPGGPPATGGDDIAGKTYRQDAPHAHRPKLLTFDFGRNRLAVAERAESDRALIIQRLGELTDAFDLAEPFVRIREAIEEAQQAVR
ncbi:MAG: hypothetical protein ABSG68_20020 [Thermoguttaceae bacterium]|jgi:hypothetical protein